MADTEKEVFVDLTEGRDVTINRIVHGAFLGSQHVITLGTNRMGVDADGQIRGECAIVARLRFDNDMAKHIRDALNSALAALETPSPEKVN